MAALLICFGLIATVLGRWKLQRKEPQFFNSSYTDEAIYEEYKLHSLLDKLPGHKRILKRLSLPIRGNRSIPIDLVVIHEKGIYLIVLLELDGNIHGNESQTYWTQSAVSHPSLMFTNPVRKNERGKRAIEKLLHIKGTYHFKSLIVFNEKAALGKIIIHSDNVTVLKRNKLGIVLKENMLSSPSLFTADEIDRLHSVLEPFSSGGQRDGQSASRENAESNVIPLPSRKKR